MTWWSWKKLGLVFDSICMMMLIVHRKMHPQALPPSTTWLLELSHLCNLQWGPFCTVQFKHKVHQPIVTVTIVYTVYISLHLNCWSPNVLVSHGFSFVQPSLDWSLATWRLKSHRRQPPSPVANIEANFAQGTSALPSSILLHLARKQGSLGCLGPWLCWRSRCQTNLSP